MPSYETAVILILAMRVEHRAGRTNRTIVLLLAVCSLPFTVASGQTNQPYVPKFTFDVASIRENKQINSYTMSIINPVHAGTFVVTSFSALDLIKFAYGKDSFQISAAPDWMSKARFDIQTKSDPVVDEALKRLGDDQAKLEKKHMLQMLLADRFNLKVHQEVKELPAFALVVLKGGSKIYPAKAEEAPDEPGMPPIYQRNYGIRGLEFIVKGATMESFAQVLEGQFQTPVSDKTGLVGTYDFTLQYHGTETDDSTDDGNIWPPIRRAIQEQLGLKLERTKAPVTILVIDHIEKPSEN